MSTEWKCPHCGARLEVVWTTEGGKKYGICRTHGTVEPKED